MTTKKKASKKAAKKAPGKGAKAGAGGAKPSKKKKVSRAPAKGKRPKKEPVWVAAFIEEFAARRCVAAACEVIGKHVSTVYARRNSDKKFRDKWDDIVAMRNETLKGTMIRQAIEGTAGRPVVYEEILEDLDDDGDVIRTRRRTRVVPVRDFDHRLQLSLAAAFMPNEFGKGADDSDSEKAKADRVCSLLEVMMGSVPEFEEEPGAAE